MELPIRLTGRALSLSTLKDALARPQAVQIDSAALKAVERSRAQVEQLTIGTDLYYGINTGFGILANQRIPQSEVERLQLNLILSHAVGVGAEVPDEIVRLMLLLKINGLLLGYSGVRPVVIDYLLRFWRQDILPIIYTKGSLGASGDLAPLAHLVLPLLGLGDVKTPGGRKPAADALNALGLAPLQLASKEGLGLINGTQFMSAYGVHTLLRIRDLLKLADVAVAYSLEALRGSAAPFDARIHEARPHPGAIEAARNIRRILQGSEILPSHADCGKVQDPYSLRCAPQVHGAARDAVRHAQGVVEIELNSATDNPLIFEDGAVLSGGNFHGEPLAFVLDYLALAAAELASISERRLYLLLGGDTGRDVRVPRLLTAEAGLNSGFMLLQYTAAALVSENKVFAHPASVDSIPSSLGQEDHVSMGSIAATKLVTVVENAETVLALEFLGAAQALDFLRPLRSGPAIEAVHAVIRRELPFAERDRLMHPDIQAMLRLVRSGSLTVAVEAITGPLD